MNYSSNFFLVKMVSMDRHLFSILNPLCFTSETSPYLFNFMTVLCLVLLYHYPPHQFKMEYLLSEPLSYFPKWDNHEHSETYSKGFLHWNQTILKYKSGNITHLVKKRWIIFTLNVKTRSTKPMSTMQAKVKIWKLCSSFFGVSYYSRLNLCMCLYFSCPRHFYYSPAYWSSTPCPQCFVSTKMYKS